MFYLFIQCFLVLVISTLLKKDFIRLVWLYLGSIILYLFVNYVLPLPDGFNDDQYAYLELVNEGTSNTIKTFYHSLFNPYLFFNNKIILEYVQYFLGFSNLFLLFLLFDKGLDSLKMLLFIVLCSGYSLHIFTFLREPFLYLFISLFLFYLLKGKFLLSLTLTVLIGLARIDSLLYILPLWTIALPPRFRFRSIYKIVPLCYIFIYWMIFFGPLSIYTEPYIRAFSLMNDLESNNTINQNILNLITPSLSISKVLFQIQLILGFYFIFKLKRNVHFYKICRVVFFFTLLILLTISNNFGWLLRLTSGIILILFILNTYIDRLQKKPYAA